MKTVLVLSVLLCITFAAPPGDNVQVPEEVMEAPQVKETAAVAEDAAENEMAVALETVTENQEGQTPESRNSCPQGWYSQNSRCFLFVNRPSSWFNAMEQCIILGGHLASVTTSLEYKFLQIITEGKSSFAWLGGFYLQNQWLWMDGERFVSNIWDSRYNSYASSSYPCTFLQTNYGWGKSRCETPRPFICSKSAYSC